jgi:calcium-dependent protein kinase
MHTMHVCHRDLKPDNFLLAERGVPIMKNTLKVIDFGLAKRFEPRVSMRTAVGTVDYAAPEIMSNKYDEKCDVWSCGVNLYVLISGISPFTGSTHEATMRKVCAGKVSFDLPEFGEVSLEVKTLIKQMVRVSPTQRLAAGDALRSSWVQGNIDVRACVLHVKDIVNNFRGFSRINRFKKAALNVVAHRLDHERIKFARELFNNFDANGDGKISPKEFDEVCQRADLLRPREVKELFDSIDLDRDGNISYIEFLAPIIAMKTTLDEEMCRQAFHIFDRDGNGVISKAELHQVLQELECQLTSTADVHALMEETDLDGNGTISFDEFWQMMQPDGSVVGRL